MRDNAALSAEQLQDKMLHLIRSQGVLEGLRAQLRHRLYSALLTDQPAPPPPVPEDRLLPLQVSNWLVYHHLEHLQYHYTLSTFRTEAGLGNPALTEKDVLLLLGLNSVDSSLLLNLVHSLINRTPQQNDKLYHKLLNVPPPALDTTNLLIFSAIKNNKVASQETEQLEARERQVRTEEARLDRLRTQLTQEVAGLQATEAQLRAEVEAQTAGLARERELLLRRMEELKAREEDKLSFGSLHQNLYDTKLGHLEQLEQRLLHKQRLMKEEESRMEQRWLESEQVRVTLRQVEIDLKTTQAENEMLQKQNRQLLEQVAKQADYPLLHSQLDLARHQLAELRREYHMGQPARQQLEQRLWELETARNNLQSHWRQAHQALVSELDQARETNALLIKKNELLSKQLSRPYKPAVSQKESAPPALTEAQRRFQALEEEAAALERKLEEFRTKNSRLGSTVRRAAPPMFLAPPPSWSPPPPLSLPISSDSSPTPLQDLSAFQYLNLTDLPAPKTSTPQATFPKSMIHSFLSSNQMADSAPFSDRERLVQRSPTSEKITFSKVVPPSRNAAPPESAAARSEERIRNPKSQPSLPDSLPTTSQSYNPSGMRLSAERFDATKLPIDDLGQGQSYNPSGMRHSAERFDATKPPIDDTGQSDSTSYATTKKSLGPGSASNRPEDHRDIPEGINEIKKNGKVNPLPPLNSAPTKFVTAHLTKSGSIPDNQTLGRPPEMDSGSSNQQDLRTLVNAESSVPPGKYVGNEDASLGRQSARSGQDLFRLASSSIEELAPPREKSEMSIASLHKENDDRNDEETDQVALVDGVPRPGSRAAEEVAGPSVEESDRLPIVRDPWQQQQQPVERPEPTTKDLAEVEEISEKPTKPPSIKEYTVESAERLSSMKENDSKPRAVKSPLTRELVQPRVDKMAAKSPLTREILQSPRVPEKSPLTMGSIQKSARSPLTREILQQRRDVEEKKSPLSRELLRPSSSESSVSDDMVSAAQKRRVSASGDATNQQPPAKPEDSSSEASLW